jgi:hypothetical protein
LFRHYRVTQGADAGRLDFKNAAGREPVREIAARPSLAGVPVTMTSPDFSVMKVLP